MHRQCFIQCPPGARTSEPSDGAARELVKCESGGAADAALCVCPTVVDLIEDSNRSHETFLRFTVEMDAIFMLTPECSSFLAVRTFAQSERRAHTEMTEDKLVMRDPSDGKCF